VDGKGGKKGVAGSGRTSKVGGGKKGKETPAVDATPAVIVPQKPPTTMKKRGEEDLDSKYIGKLSLICGAIFTLAIPLHCC